MISNATRPCDISRISNRSLLAIESELRRHSSNNAAYIQYRIQLLRKALHCEKPSVRDALLRKALSNDSEIDDMIQYEVAPVVPMSTRTEKMADAAWSMRAKSQRFVNPELRQYDEKHVAVFEQRIVAYGDDYTEVLHRAMAECGVPYHRIILDFWGNPSRLQSIPESDDV